MKNKTICALLLSGFAVLTSCGGKEDSAADYFNLDAGCMAGNTFYLSAGEVSVWNPMFEEIRHGLCRNPLCSHNDPDAVCPDYSLLWQKSIITDGVKLYMSAINASLTDTDGVFRRQIYSLNFDGSDFTLLAAYDTSGAASSLIRYSDGYIYYEQGLYRDGYDLSADGGRDDQYKKIMRIPSSGGSPEAVLDSELDMMASFYVDGENYYVISSADNAAQSLTVIDKSSGSVSEEAFGDVEGYFFGMRVYRGRTYLITSAPKTFSALRDDGTTAEKLTDNCILYYLDGGSTRKIAEGNFTFASDGIWYTTTECEYLGTSETTTEYSGETEEADCFAVTVKSLVRLDPDDYTAEEYFPGEGFADGDSIELIAGAGGVLWADVWNDKTLFSEGNAAYRSCLIKTENGSASVSKIYK